jgi:hypothetical protein
VILDFYQKYSFEALLMCEGDQEKADYFMDCAVYQYFYRVRQKLKYFQKTNPK